MRFWKKNHMSNGQFYTLDQFGWNATQTDAVQRANVLSAFDSGEPLEMPKGEDVRTDQPLISTHPLHLVGHGPDITNTATALSQFRTSVANIDILQILAGNSIVANINFHSDAIGTGRGVVVGDGATKQPAGVLLDHISTGSNLFQGVAIISGQELTIRDSWLNGQDAAFCTDNENSDAGDNRIEGGEFNAFGSLGAGIRMLSGGGLFAGDGLKLLSCYNHIAVAWHKSGSGGLIVSQVSAEGCRSTVSFDIDGSVPFERMEFGGDISWGNASTCVAVRSSHSVKWLKQLTITNNPMKVMGPPSLSAVDIDYCDELDVHGNNIDGTGHAYCGIIVREHSSGMIGTNTIRNVTMQAIYNLAGAAVNVAPFQG